MIERRAGWLQPGEPVNGDLVGALFLGMQSAAMGTEGKKPAHRDAFSGCRVKRAKDHARLVLANQIFDLETPNH